MAISESFAKVLAAGRTQFNQRVAEARRRYPAFDPAAFADFLQHGVDNIISAVGSKIPERLAFVSLIAYDIALELVGQALAGPQARSALVNLVWQKVMPAYVHLLSENPTEVLGLLSNAAINIGKITNVRGEQWINELIAIAPQVESLTQLQIVGQVLAWRAGVAHFRIGAIHAADQLPEVLALASIGAPNTMRWPELKANLLANSWCRPDGSMPSTLNTIEIGQFTGFGGEFPEPPEIRACREGFVIKSGERYTFLIADVFGAVLHGATKEEFDHAQMHKFPPLASVNGSRIMVGKRSINMDLPTNQLNVICNNHTIAVTSPYTHAVRLLAVQ